MSRTSWGLPIKSSRDARGARSNPRRRPASASASGVGGLGHHSLERKNSTSMSFTDANKQMATLDSGGSALSLIQANGAQISALNSPSGSGLRGARSLVQSSLHRSDEIATLQAKSWRAAQEANTLRERIQQIETQFKLRLQITLQRGEERQKELSQLIERQKSDLHNLQTQRDHQTSCHVKEMAGLKSENGKLRSEIAEKQKALERSIAHRHKVEESLVEMSRWFRTKGKFSDNIPIDELLNRFATLWEEMLIEQGSWSVMERKSGVSS